MSAVRVRNITYALSGSVSGSDGKGHQVRDMKYRLEPNVWTEVEDAVYEQLYSKFGNSRFSEAPNSLPGANGEYLGAPGQTRAEQTNGQYLIEFRK
jgi:hypothetical protein